MLFDVGEYEIGTSDSSRRDGRDHSPDTSDDEAFDSASDAGANHERALLRSYKRGSIIVHLRGQRIDCRIALVKPPLPNQTTFAKSTLTDNVTARKSWLLRLAPKDGKYYQRNKLPELEMKSILTGRTMDEIKAEVKQAGERLVRLRRQVHQGRARNPRIADPEDDGKAEHELDRLEAKEKASVVRDSHEGESDHIAENEEAVLKKLTEGSKGTMFASYFHGDGKQDVTSVQRKIVEKTVEHMAKGTSSRKRRRYG